LRGEAQTGRQQQRRVSACTRFYCPAMARGRPPDCAGFPLRGHRPAIAFPQGYPLVLPSLLSFGKLTLLPGEPRIELPVESGLGSPVTPDRPGCRS
jgi:hypothetical protein